MVAFKSLDKNHILIPYMRSLLDEITGFWKHFVMDVYLADFSEHTSFPQAHIGQYRRGSLSKPVLIRNPIQTRHEIAKNSTNWTQRTQVVEEEGYTHEMLFDEHEHITCYIGKMMIMCSSAIMIIYVHIGKYWWAWCPKLYCFITVNNSYEIFMELCCFVNWL